MDYFALVAQAYGSLTATERRLADYLCAHAALAERMNIRELAQAAGRIGEHGGALRAGPLA